MSLFKRLGAAIDSRVITPHGQATETPTWGPNDVLEALQKHARATPSSAVTQLYRAYASQKGCAGPTERFAAGAAHLGYASRLTEEDDPEGGSDPIPEVTEVIRWVWESSPTENDWRIVLFTAGGYAVCGDWPRGRLDVMAIPGPLSDLRGPLRERALALLTNPGAEFRSRPPQLSPADVAELWAFGYAVRCAEASLPEVPGRSYDAFVKRA
jgi:hypothetical protein